MIGDWVELNAVDGFLKLKGLNYFVISVIDDVESAFLPAWNYVIAFAGDGIDVWFMDIGDLLAQTTDPQVPHTDLLILSSRNKHLIIFESNVLNLLVSF